MKIEVKIYDKETKTYSNSVDIEEFIIRPNEIQFEWENGNTLPYKDFMFYAEDFCYSIFVNGEKDNKDKVTTDLLKRIATLEYEVERQDNIIEEVENYVEKMSYSSIVDNPKKDLQKILKKENKND